MSKSVEPSISEAAFNCPHCGAFTTQFWHVVYCERLGTGPEIPRFPDEEFIKTFSEMEGVGKEAVQMARDWIKNVNTKLVYLDSNKGKYLSTEAGNLFLAQCFNCKKISVWVHDRLIFPAQKSAQANEDLPEDILLDFDEASRILNISPRGAAALLRLCIQKLCKSLGEKGQNLDDDIASLVAKGLNPLIQKSLDIVRVIGNEAVHPGAIDLSDDRDTALKLFGLVNAIAEQMISHPKSVNMMWEKIPPTKREAISRRDGKPQTT